MIVIAIFIIIIVIFKWYFFFDSAHTHTELFCPAAIGPGCLCLHNKGADYLIAFSSERCLHPLFQTLTEVRALQFPEVFSKNNMQEVSGSLLLSSGCKQKLHLN